MKTAAAFGRDLDARLKAVIQVHKEGLEKAEASGDLKAKKFVIQGCQYIDTLAKATYALDHEINTLPAVALPLKSMSKDAAARVFETAVRALEVRAQAIKGAGPVAILKGGIGAIEPLTEPQFYPDGQYDWYNPADWFRAAKFEAYQTLNQAINSAQQLEQGVGDSVEDAADAAAAAASKGGDVFVKYAAAGIALALLFQAAKKQIQKT